ncbi:hypothetical protein JHK86_034027 [Glycine max]|nr:hypothetical protein JHK86_034027 [Glycine max]
MEVFEMYGADDLDCLCKTTDFDINLREYRNSRLLDETNIPLATAISLATQHFSQWSQVQATSSSWIYTNSCQHISRNPPYHNFLKCNLDAAIFQESNSFRAGFCLRDSNGSFVKAKTISASSSPSLTEAEAWALSKAIIWIRQQNIHNVIFEVDYKHVAGLFQSLL